jgi:hypothetical protein
LVTGEPRQTFQQVTQGVEVGSIVIERWPGEVLLAHHRRRDRQPPLIPKYLDDVQPLGVALDVAPVQGVAGVPGKVRTESGEHRGRVSEVLVRYDDGRHDEVVTGLRRAGTLASLIDECVQSYVRHGGHGTQIKLQAAQEHAICNNPETAGVGTGVPRYGPASLVNCPTSNSSSANSSKR